MVTIDGAAGPTVPDTSGAGLTSCVYADGLNAFKAPLADGDLMTFGDRGWLDGATSAADVEVDGTVGVVEVRDGTVQLDSCDPDAVSQLRRGEGDSTW